MVVYNREEDLSWHSFSREGLELAVLAHGDPGKLHGACVGLPRAFDCAQSFGAIPISHDLAYRLPLQYPDLTTRMLAGTGDNHTWFSSTLCIYLGYEEELILPSHRNKGFLTNFGHMQETAASADIVYMAESDDSVCVYNYILRSIDRFPRAATPSAYLWVDVPSDQRNKFHVVSHPHYSLDRHGTEVQVHVDWDNTRVVPANVEHSRFASVRNSDLFPSYLRDGYRESETGFVNPMIGFLAPAESFGSDENLRGEGFNYWRITGRGEAVIIQRPLKYQS